MITDIVRNSHNIYVPIVPNVNGILESQNKKIFYLFSDAPVSIAAPPPPPPSTVATVSAPTLAPSPPAAPAADAPVEPAPQDPSAAPVPETEGGNNQS